MKSGEKACLATIIFAGLAISFPLAAQEKHAQHHHYKLVDMGTFGGPQSYVDYPDLTSEADVSAQGVLAGWADTDKPDPFPSFCFWDCFVVRTFQWQNGVRSDLGALPGGASSQSAWISANGLIAGWSQNGKIDPLITGYPENQAVLWKDRKIRDLGTLPEGGHESLGLAVNRSGLVVGLATNTISDSNSMFGFGYQARAFAWDQWNGMQDLGTLPGGTDAQAVLVNERGEVAGWSYTSSEATTAPACTGAGMSLTTGTFLWDGENGMTDVGTLGGDCTNVLGLNNRGQVVGLSYLAEDQYIHAFLWDRTSGIQDLGTLGGDFANAFAINDSGDVVGGSDLPDGQPDAALWGKSGITDLGELPGGCGSFAFSINARRQVVGNAFNDCSFETTTGFLWEDGAPMADLNNLIVPGSGLFVFVGITINDRGEIAAEGTLPNGDERAVLLIPCDQNHPGVAGCDYSMVDADAATGVSPAPVIGEWISPNPPTFRLFGRSLSFMPGQTGVRSARRAMAHSGGSNSQTDSADAVAKPDGISPIGQRASVSGSDVARKCTPEGHPCGSAACCPGLVCTFRGGSTRVGYACEPKNFEDIPGVNSFWDRINAN
jgi:probable HAF family extracellular repeat protein